MTFIIEEMEEVRKYCSLIHLERTKAGFISTKYPLIKVTLNRYFLPEFRELIADECNLIGYMDIQPVEYDWNQEVPAIIDTTKSEWQEAIFNSRLEKRATAEDRKAKGL